MINKKELEELNDFLEVEMNNIGYGRSKTGMFIIKEGHLFRDT